MKKMFIFSLTVLTVLFSSGCGMFNKPGFGETVGRDISEYEIIEEIDHLPAEIADITEQLKSKRGYYVFNPKDYATGKDVYVLISAGEKPTGGYLIKVESVSSKNNTLKVVVEETEPATGEGVIQVLTYPFVIVKVFNLYENFDIKNRQNITFKEISPENAPMLWKESGQYVGQIDNNSIEIEVDGKAKAFMLDKQELIQNVNDGDKVVFEYFKDEYERLVIRSIEKAN